MRRKKSSTDSVIVKLLGSPTSVRLTRARAAEYNAICDEVLREWRPANAVEESLVGEIANNRFVFSRHACGSDPDGALSDDDYAQRSIAVQRDSLANIQAVQQQLIALRAQRRDAAIAAALNGPLQSVLVH